ncbi:MULTISPECIES: type II toxin-antitoxin system CcdA family antitoxin [Photorhabdus]|nr:type II toxin-antitoxin system CcdA family antitoxin [Photorhabdus thracensis]
MNLSATLKQALANAVSERKRQKWIEENKTGIEALNGFINEAGLFSDDERFRVS